MEEAQNPQPEIRMELEAWQIRKEIPRRKDGVKRVQVELRYHVDAAVLTFRIPWTALLFPPRWGRAEKKVAAKFRNSSDVRAYPAGWRETLRKDFVAVCNYVVKTKRLYGSGAEVRQNA